MDFTTKLKTKCQLVRDHYSNKYERADQKTYILSKEELKLFCSMERFHNLGHTRFDMKLFNLDFTKISCYFIGKRNG